MLEFIPPPKFDVNTHTGIQIWQLNFIVSKASFNRKFTINGKCGFLSLEVEVISRCRRFSEKPLISHLLSIADILPAI